MSNNNNNSEDSVGSMGIEEDERGDTQSQGKYDSSSDNSNGGDYDYDSAIASEDPTNISNEELEDLAKKAMKKFKSLG